jgi:hypothetical protein
LSFWVESASQDLFSIEEKTGQRAVCTFQTEMFFGALLASASGPGDTVSQVATYVERMLKQGQPLNAVLPAVLSMLPPGEHVPLAILRVVGGAQAQLVEVDAPPLFLVRRGRPVLLPVVEEDLQGRLVRQCEFTLQEGDHLAMVSAEYIRAKGWDRRWGWRDVALSIKRLTDTGGDADQLLGALIRMYHRLAQGEPAAAVTVLAMHVRPRRSVTVWSGPPGDPAHDAQAVERLFAEPDRRIICGDTTAAVAARVLGRTLEQEPRPAAGWAEVPPTWRLEGVDLVTEGVVTLRKTRERLNRARRAADLPRANDGATRLARLLLEADVIRFLIGTAVNPAQRDGGVSWRQEVLINLVADLKVRGKIVSVEYLGEED